jgi:hypothetical protein
MRQSPSAGLETYSVCAPATHGVDPAGSLGQHCLGGVCLYIVTCPGPIRTPHLKAGWGQEGGDDRLQLVAREPGERGSVPQLKKTDQG